MAKIVKRKTQRKIRKARAEGVRKRIIKPSLRDTLMYQQMMGMQRGTSQAPQSSIDSMKHELYNAIAKKDADHAKEMKLMKEEAKNRHDEQMRRMQEHEAALQRERVDAEAKHVQARIDGENEQGKLDIEKHKLNFEKEELERVKQKQVEEINVMLKKGNIEQQQNAIDALRKEITVLKEREEAIAKHLPTAYQENTIIINHMTAISTMLKDFDNAVFKISTAAERKALYKPKQLDGEIQALTKTLSQVQAELKSVEAEVQQYERKENEIAILRDETSKVDLLLARERGKLQFHRKEEAEAQAEHKKHAKQIDDITKYNDELYKQNPNALQSEYKQYSTLPPRTKYTYKEKLTDLNMRRADYEDQIRGVQAENEKDKMLMDAIYKAGHDANAAEIELLQQRAVYDHNNPDKESVVRRSDEVATKRVEAEEAQRNVQHLKDLGKQNEELLKIKTERDTQAMINAEEFDADDSITQALTNNQVVIGATLEDIRSKKINQAAFHELMDGNPLLRDSMNLPQENFNGYPREHQTALLHAIQQGLKGDNTQVGAYDSAQKANLTEVFDEYWAAVEKN